jgi:hypothetical protein
MCSLTPTVPKELLMADAANEAFDTGRIGNGIKTKLTHAHCRNSARCECETLVQRAIDLCKERREGAK